MPGTIHNVQKLPKFDQEQLRSWPNTCIPNTVDNDQSQLPVQYRSSNKSNVEKHENISTKQVDAFHQQMQQYKFELARLKQSLDEVQSTHNKSKIVKRQSYRTMGMSK